ncbi:molybdenum cofactor guanylyltransferase MobA [Hydrogenophilus thiooxidans]|uniref:molybdenum cofactor guanylyltransferase MobA n=1 Tax=Hydrogenophilus thiooxidans TaxID=2820326 RepID=UPI001C244582|nr:molybdenum cofactor guanylyltransferase MobA [Hydrogenophilus thiooxidans]
MLDTEPDPNRFPVTGLILAGGEGRRMGGVDKGWVTWRDKPLIAWAIERLRPQVAQLLVSANRSLDRYRALGYPVVSDPPEWRFAGPLAGIAAGLAAAPSDWVVTVPCDAPLLPRDLVARFLAAAHAAGAFAAADDADRAGDPLPPVFFAHDGTRPHPVFLLVHRAHLPSLAAFLATHRRRIDAWYGTLPHRAVSFADEPDAFANCNDPESLAQLAATVR